MGAPLMAFGRSRAASRFTHQNPRLLKIELSETSVMARSGSMVIYRGGRPIDFGMQRRRLINLKRRIEAAAE